MQSLNDVFLTKRECLKEGCKGIIVYDDVGNEFVLTTNQEFKHDAKFVLFSVSNFSGQLDGIAVVHDGANKPVVFQESENACNQAFEAFGVVRSKSLDEFETLGLYKYFDNFDIFKSSKYLDVSTVDKVSKKPCVLTYETTGHNKLCNQTVGANSSGCFSVMYYLESDEAAEVAARRHLNGLVANGFTVSKAIFTNSNDVSICKSPIT